jgi:hypothetical protein
MAGGAAQRRIAVLQPDDELLRAVSLALSPWDVETIKSDAAPPQPSQPEAVQVASQLAHRLEVEAIVWVSSTERGALLWVFDARAGDITTRMLAETPPFDSAAAAAVALSVKTVLRSSVVAPPAERFGAEPAPPKGEHVAALELGAGGYWVADQETEVRFELGAVVWLAAARRLGLGLELSSGPGLNIEDAGFRGRYREVIAGAKARFRLIREPRVAADVSLGGALHWATLEGILVESSIEKSVSRVNPSLDLETMLSVRIDGAAYFGAALGAAYTPTYRRYLVEGNPVFSPWPVVVGLGGFFGVELF